jgi:hypothetical protein
LRGFSIKRKSKIIKTKINKIEIAPTYIKNKSNAKNWNPKNHISSAIFRNIKIKNKTEYKGLRAIIDNIANIRISIEKKVTAHLNSSKTFREKVLGNSLKAAYSFGTSSFMSSELRKNSTTKLKKIIV